MKLMAVAGAGLLVIAVQGCSVPQSTECSNLSDREAMDTVVRAYNSESTTARSGPLSAEMKFSKDRLLGVGRSGGSSADDVTQLWFLQDDKTVTIASVYGDCGIKFSPGEKVEHMKSAAYWVAPPRVDGPEAITTAKDAPSRK